MAGIGTVLWGDVDSVPEVVPWVAWAVSAVVFAVVGGLIARSRGASPVVGGILGLMCGVFGLLFTLKLPVRDTLPESKRRPSLLHPDDGFDGRPIDPDVAAQLGLPKQQDPAAAESASAPSGWWAPDPTGRFAERWWNGAEWTINVRDGAGTERLDPLDPLD